MEPRARGLELGRGHISAEITARAEHKSPFLINEPPVHTVACLLERVGRPFNQHSGSRDGGDSSACTPSVTGSAARAVRRAWASRSTREPGSERESRRQMTARKLAIVAVAACQGPSLSCPWPSWLGGAAGLGPGGLDTPVI